MPEALDRKYPNAGRELGWFWVFPSQDACRPIPAPASCAGITCSDSVMQKAVKSGGRAGKHPQAGVGAYAAAQLRDALLLSGVDIRQIQDTSGMPTSRRR